MEIEVRADGITIDGYVNAVERESRPVMTKYGRVVEKIKQGAFRKALERNKNVKLLLNHNDSRQLGSQEQGNLQLHEDNIGLKVHTVITDPEVVEKGKTGRLKGWSFRMISKKDKVESRAEPLLPIREVSEMELLEVSLIDDTRRPFYSSTSLEIRAEGEEETEIQEEVRAVEFLDAVYTMVETPKETKNLNYQYKNRYYKSRI